MIQTDNFTEVWKPVYGYEGIYEVSSFGNIRSIDRFVPHKVSGRQFIKGRNMTCIKNNFGYFIVTMSKNGIVKKMYVHRLVAEAFIPNFENKPHVNHIDGDKSNNNIDNLGWVTALENNEHAWDTGLNRNCRQSVLAENVITGDKIIFKSILDADRFAGGHVCQYIENGTIHCDYKFKFLDKSKDERVAEIIKSKQPVGGNIPIKVKCVETGEIFSSVRQCSKKIGICADTIFYALRHSDGHIRKYDLSFEIISN